MGNFKFVIYYRLPCAKWGTLQNAEEGQNLRRRDLELTA